MVFNANVINYILYWQAAVIEMTIQRAGINNYFSMM